MLKKLKKIIDQPGPVFGPSMRKWQLFCFWLSVAVAVGLPALICFAIIIGQVGNSR
jgi:hypothetical protein